MAAKTFCNVENAADGDDHFVFGGPGGVTIHTTVSPHTLDGWAASQVDGAWQVAAPPVHDIDTLIDIATR